MEDEGGSEDEGGGGGGGVGMEGWWGRRSLGIRD